MTTTQTATPILLTIVSCLVSLLAGDAHAFPLPDADYRFQNTRNSSVGSAPALTDIGPGSNSFGPATVDGAARTVLRFPLANGLKLAPTTGVVASGTYTVVVFFEFDSVDGYNRIIDFKNGTKDNGLYVQNRLLRFYPHSTGTASIPANTPVQVAITRDASSKQVVAYVGGVQQFSFTDTANDAVIDSARALRFFRDNESGASTEHSAGSVARIRLFKRALAASEIASLDRGDFIVNSTADRPDTTTSDGRCFTGHSANPFAFQEECTLRAALQEAEVGENSSTINFGIPTRFGTSPNPDCNQTTRVCRIKPAGDLPTILSPVLIDGYTQGEDTPAVAADDATENTLPNGTNAALKIELSGEAAGETYGLFVNGDRSVIRGLVINRWQGDGILLSTGRFNNIAGNFIGTDPTGAAKLGNSTGVSVSGAEHTLIGGTTPASRNLISGNVNSGVAITWNSFEAIPVWFNRVEGNLIGTNAQGTGALGNGGTGVAISDAIASTVGGTSAAARNIIAFNAGHGIVLGSGSSGANQFLRNSITGNGGRGIDLGNDGVTANDAGDTDLGPNRLQNYPVVTSATTSSTATTISGRLNSTPDRDFTIQVFSSAAADPSRYGEGGTFLGQTTVRTNASGNAIFSFSPGARLPVGRMVTTTATGLDGTSEFSRALGVVSQ